eukprot:scaffold110474_cov54-Phaeocystis_antarctica.AAC.3
MSGGGRQCPRSRWGHPAQSMVQQPRDISFGAAAESLTKIFTGLSEWQQQQQSNSHMSIDEQACVVDAYEWVAKYSNIMSSDIMGSNIMGFFCHETWHDLAMVDLVTELKISCFKKMREVEAAGGQLMGHLAKRHSVNPCQNCRCTYPFSSNGCRVRTMGDRIGTCRAIEEFRQDPYGANPAHQDACDTQACVTRGKLIEVCGILLELKAEIDLKLEHRRTRAPELLQVLHDRVSSGAAAVAAMAVASKAGDVGGLRVGGLRVVLTVSGRNIDAPLPLGQIEPNESHEDGMRPLYLVAQWLAPADASRLMRHDGAREADDKRRHGPESEQRLLFHASSRASFTSTRLASPSPAGRSPAWRRQARLDAPSRARLPVERR